MKQLTVNMAQASTAVAKVNPARQAVVIDTRTQMLSQPGWVRSLVNLKTNVWDHQKGLIPTLPIAYGSLTVEERTDLERRVADIDLVLAIEQCPVSFETDDGAKLVTADQAKLLMLGRLMMAKASAAMSKEQAAARAESYMEALDETPAWAVKVAISNWHKGIVRGVAEADFKWAPDSAVLRRACADVMRPYAELRGDLRRVLEAKPMDQVA